MIQSSKCLIIVTVPLAYYINMMKWNDNIFNRHARLVFKVEKQVKCIYNSLQWNCSFGICEHQIKLRIKDNYATGKIWEGQKHIE